MNNRAVVDNEVTEKYLRIASISIALYEWVCFYSETTTRWDSILTDWDRLAVISSRSLRNGDFIEVNHQFLISGVYLFTQIASTHD